MMEVWTSGFAEHQRAILLAVEVHREWWLANAHWWEYQTTGFFLGCERSFQRNSVHDSRMRIFCEFCAKRQKFVRIRLEEKFLNAFKMTKIRVHRLEKLSQDNCKRQIFILHCRNSMTPSTN
jgi:hypothetical protein